MLKVEIFLYIIRPVEFRLVDSIDVNEIWTNQNGILSAVVKEG
jgi:hypothetical protein